jgi:hypothetical protein
MTLRSWVRKLFARPAVRPTHKDQAGCRPTMESLEDPAPPTITCNLAGGKAKPPRDFSAPGEQAWGSVVHTRRFSPPTIGFWLGGAGMGMGGCLLGALMPYHHPVAVTLSVLWWGIYFGCFGACVGALVGIDTDRAPPRPSATWDGAGMVPTELGLDSHPAEAGSTAVCAARGPRGLPGPQRECQRPA